MPRAGRTPEVGEGDEMSDATGPQRPRPQYGEYASAEEQRARIRTPIDSPPASAPTSSGLPPAPPVPQWGAQAPLQRQARQTANRVITIGLLAYGAVSVLLSVFSFSDLTAVFDDVYRSAGIPGSFQNTTSAGIWGTVASVVLVAGYAVTVLLSVLALRRRRMAWWIPLVGAVVTYLLVSACVAVPLMSDPTLLNYVSSRGAK